MTLWTGQRVIRTAKEFDVTVRIVCASCNNGWMHDLERAFRALMLLTLHGVGITLSRPSQRVVALWGVKTWLMLERAFAHHRGGGFAPDEFFQFLFEKRYVPGNVRVWLGTVDAVRTQISYLSTTAVLEPDGSETGGVAVFTIGNLLFHIFVPTWTPAPFRRRMTLDVGKDLTPYLVDIWPDRVEQVSWPPTRVFTIDDLHRRWPPFRSMIVPVKPAP